MPAFHIYLSLLHMHVMLTCDTCLYGFSLFWSYGSPCLLHVLLFHVPAFMLYDCFLLRIWIFLILEMRAVDMRYVGSPHLLFSFLDILFMLSCSRYIVPDSRYIVLCYQQNSSPVIMLPISCPVVILVTWYT